MKNLIKEIIISWIQNNPETLQYRKKNIFKKKKEKTNKKSLKIKKQIIYINKADENKTKKQII